MKWVGRNKKISFTQWQEASNDEKEEIVQRHMWEMFTPSPDYQTALYQASDDIFERLKNMDASMSEIVASFTPAIENYLGIFSTHLAVLDRKWVISDIHVDMAKEILLDLFDNLISWLEDSVEIGGNKAKEGKIIDELLYAFNSCTEYELDGSGDGWRRKTAMLNQYMEITGVSKSTAERHFKDYSVKLFNSKKSGKRVYLKRKGTK